MDESVRRKVCRLIAGIVVSDEDLSQAKLEQAVQVDHDADPTARTRGSTRTWISLSMAATRLSPGARPGPSVTPRRADRKRPTRVRGPESATGRPAPPVGGVVPSATGARGTSAPPLSVHPRAAVSCSRAAEST